MTKITLIISCFNQGTSVKELIKACLSNLKMSHFRLIVADDGSVESEITELRTYCNENSIPFISGDNVGTFQNIRRALPRVTTSHFTIMPGDDSLDFYELEKVRNHKLLEIPNIALVSRLIRVNVDKNNLEVSREFLIPKNTGIRFMDKLILRHYNVAGSGSMIFPTELFRTSLKSVPKGRFLLEDWINNSAFLKSGGRIIQSEYFPYLYMKQVDKPGITDRKADLKKEVLSVSAFVKEEILGSSRNKLKDYFSHKIYKYVYIVAERSWLLYFHRVLTKFLLTLTFMRRQV